MKPGAGQWTDHGMPQPSYLRAKAQGPAIVLDEQIWLMRALEEREKILGVIIVAAGI